MTPLKLIFAGSGHFGLPTLQALREAGHDVVRVVSQPDRPAGRGRKLTPTPIAQYAIDHGLPLSRPERIADESLPPADAMVVIAFGQKVPEPIVRHPRLGSINLHASLLPKYRGAAPINWAILSGETVTGNSVIRLAQKMDAGAILGQSRVEIGPTETAGELHDRLSLDGPALVLKVFGQLSAGTATEIPQDENLATLAPKLSRETAAIDFSRPAADVARRINGLSPWPGCRTRLVDRTGQELARLTLLRARATTAEQLTAPPGHLTPAGHITCGHSTTLELLDLQPEAKRPMPLSTYRNGHPWPAGSALLPLT